MMLTLVIYILKRLVNHGTADGECGITALPFKLLIMRCDGFYPSATVAFHLFHDMGYAHVHNFLITNLGTRCFDVEYRMYVYFAQ